MPPKLATRLLLASGLTCAVISLVALGLLAATLLGRFAMATAASARSTRVLDRHDPVSPVIAGLAAATLVVVGALTARAAARWVLAFPSAGSFSMAGRRVGPFPLYCSPYSSPSAS